MLSLKSSATGMFRRPTRIFQTLFTLFLITALTYAAQAQELRAMNATAPNAAVVKDKGDEKTASAKAETRDYSEMMKLVEALEERVRQLEAKLAKVEAAKPAETATTGAVTTAVKPDDVTEIRKEVAAITEEAKKNDGAIKFFRDVELSGIVDGYYSYN